MLPHLSAKPEPNEMVPVWKGRRRLWIWSFRRSGGNGMEQASSDAEGAFGAGAPFEPPGISAGSPRQRARWFAMTLLFEIFDAMYGQVALNIF